MIITPARKTGSAKESSLPSVLRPSRSLVRTVFPSYFAAGTQIFPESVLPDVPGANAAQLHFTSQLLPSPLARRVA
jgi:hypothetical protein